MYPIQNLNQYIISINKNSYPYIDNNYQYPIL